MNLEQIQQQVDALRSEVNALQKAVVELEAQHTQADSGLNEILARAERSADATAQQAATQAEATVAELAGQLRRKRAAHQAAQNDLAQATTELQTAKLVAQCDQLETIHNELGALATALNTDTNDVGKWLDVHHLITKGKQVYRPGAPLYQIESFVEFWPSALDVLAKVQSRQRAALEMAIRLEAMSIEPNIAQIDIAGMLDLPNIARRIDALKRAIHAKI